MGLLRLTRACSVVVVFEGYQKLNDKRASEQCNSPDDDMNKLRRRRRDHNHPSGHSLSSAIRESSHLFTLLDPFLHNLWCQFVGHYFLLPSHGPSRATADGSNARPKQGFTILFSSMCGIFGNCSWGSCGVSPSHWNRRMGDDDTACGHILMKGRLSEMLA